MNDHPTIRPTRFRLLLPGCLLAMLAALPASGTTRTVVTREDGETGSLRAVAEAAAPGDSITFAPFLDGSELPLPDEPLVLSKPLLIKAPSLTEGVVIGEPQELVFPIHFVVLTTHPDAPTAADGDGLFHEEVDILNTYFVREDRRPVSNGRYKIRFAYKSHQFRADVEDTSNPRLLAFGDMTDPVLLDPDHPDFACAGSHEPVNHCVLRAMDEAVAECDDPRLADPFAINFYVYDHYQWDMGTGSADGSEIASHGTSNSHVVTIGPFTREVFRPLLALDVARLRHQIASPEEHEMGHVFGLAHVCDENVHSSADSSNIMTSSNATHDEYGNPVTVDAEGNPLLDEHDQELECEGDGGARDRGFNDWQVEKIITRALEIREEWAWLRDGGGGE